MRHIRRLLQPATLVAGTIAVVLSAAHAQIPRTSATDSRYDSQNRSEPAPGVTPEQMERLRARLALATALVNRFAPDARAKRLAPGWRQTALETLLPLSLEGLRRIEQEPIGLDGLAAAAEALRLEGATGNEANGPATGANAADDPGALGQPAIDLVYTPIAPCRFIDTRNIVGKIFPAFGYDLGDSGNAYGGASTCNPKVLFGVNSEKQIGAIAMNVTIVDPSAAPGFVAVKPAAASPTTSLLNWYETGASVQAANQGIVSTNLDQNAVHEFVIQTSAPVYVIADIFGAFLPPQATAIEKISLDNVTSVPNLAAGFVASPPCPQTFTLTGGGCQTQHFGHYLTETSPTISTWVCRSHNVTGVTSNLRAYALCSRTPGR